MRFFSLLINNIRTHRLLFATISFVFLLLLISSSVGVYVFNKNLQKKPQSNYYVLQVNITYDENRKNLLEIEKLEEFPAKEKPDLGKIQRLNEADTTSPYSIQLVNKDGTVLFTQKFTAINEALHIRPQIGFQVPSPEPPDKQTFFSLPLTIPALPGATTVRIIENATQKVLIEKKIPSSFNSRKLEQHGSIQATTAESTVNLLILSSGFRTDEMGTFTSAAHAATSTFFSFSPVNEFTGSIRYSVVENTEDLGCKRNPDRNNYIYCSQSRVSDAANRSGFSHDVILVIHNDDIWSGIAYMSSHQAYVTLNNTGISTTHEMGHAMFGLIDEYIAEKGDGDINHRVEYGNCFSGSESSTFTWKGCNYINWYRSSEDSIMNGTAPYFNEVSKAVIRKKFGVITGPADPTPTPTLAPTNNCGDYNCTENEVCTKDAGTGPLTCVRKGSRTSGQYCPGVEGGSSLAPEVCASGTVCEKTYGGPVPICVPNSTAGCAAGACVASYQCSGGNIIDPNPGAACVRSIGGKAVCCVRTSSGDETNAEIPLELTVIPNGVSYSNIIFGLEEVNGTTQSKTSSNVYTITYPKSGDGKLKKTTYTAYAQALSGSTPIENSTLSCTGGCKITLGDTNAATKKLTLTLSSSSGPGPGPGPSVSRPNESGFCGNQTHTAASPKESNPCLSNSHYPTPENTAGNNYCHTNFAPYDYWYTCNSSTTPPPGGGKSYTTPSREGYCATGNRVNADPKWYIKGGTPTCNFNNATYPLPNAPTIANDDAYCAGEFGGQNGYFYYCLKPGEGGGSTSDVICKDHKGVDGSKYPNGYFQPICLNQTPTQANLQNGDGKFTDANAVKKPNPYASGKNYDVYICADGTYDFAPQAGNTGVCDKYPWVQEPGGTVPTPPSGHTCPDKDKPYWDSTLNGGAGGCTFRPGACNNIGPSGKQNTCQATACGANTPDLYANEDPSEANLACKTYYSDGRNFCCGVSSGGGTPGGTCSNGKKDGSETDTDCGGSCTACSLGRACVVGNDCQSKTCTGGVCTAAPTPTPTTAASAGTGTENSHCYNGDSDCAPQFKCNRNPGTATSYCIYRNPSDPEGVPYCKSSIYHCEGDAANPAGHTTCDTGNPAPIMGHNYSCRKAGLGSICCTGASSTTASTGNEVRIGGTCTSNTQCVRLKLGNSCVYTNNPTVGVCR